MIVKGGRETLFHFSIVLTYFGFVISGKKNMWKWIGGWFNIIIMFGRSIDGYVFFDIITVFCKNSCALIGQELL